MTVWHLRLVAAANAELLLDTCHHFTVVASEYKLILHLELGLYSGEVG